MKTLLVTLVLSMFSALSLAEVLLLDVRSQAEYDAGHAYGAVHIPHTQIAEKAPTVLKDKNKVIKVYCRSGNRAGKALIQLEELGYTQVENIGGLENAKKYEPM